MRIGKWLSTVACLALVALFAATYEKPTLRRLDSLALVMVQRGAAFVRWPAYRAQNDDGVPAYVLRIACYRDHAWIPHAETEGDAGCVSVPLWLLFAVVGVPTTVLWWLDRPRIPAGHCRKCGYNLTGNLSGRCPECGTAVGERGVRA